MRTIDLPSVTDLIRDLAPPRCECEHGEAAQQCDSAADWAVTILCSEPGCTDAAAVYLLCEECLDTWVLRARSDGVRLRPRRL